MDEDCDLLHPRPVESGVPGAKPIRTIHLERRPLLSKAEVYGGVAIGTAKRHKLKYVWNIRLGIPMTLQEAASQHPPDIRLFDRNDELLEHMRDESWWEARLG